MAKLDDLLRQIRNELGADFIATAIVGSTDGIAIANLVLDPDFDVAAASARLAMVTKLAANVSTRIDLGQVEDTLTTTDQTYVLTRFLGDGSYYWWIAVSKEAVLGMVRMLMDEQAEQIWKAIPR